MTVTHLYLKNGGTEAAAVHIVRRSFTASSALPDEARFSKSLAEFAPWLATALEDRAVKAVYVCAGCLAQRPENYRGAWIPVAAGSPLEDI